MMQSNFPILIVEDDALSAEFLKQILIKHGYSVIYKASSCSETLSIIEKNSISLIFMDINIRGNDDGIMCSKKDLLLNIPIIYTTAYRDTQTITESNKTNAYGYLLKPFDDKDIFASLTIALRLIQKDISSAQPIKENSNQMLHKFENGFAFNFSNLTLKNELNNVIELTKKEAELLNFLCQHQNQNISYETLKYNLWSSDVANTTVRDLVYRLKQKLPDDFPIKNISGYGYILTEK